MDTVGKETYTVYLHGKDSPKNSWEFNTQREAQEFMDNNGRDDWVWRVAMYRTECIYVEDRRKDGRDRNES